MTSLVVGFDSAWTAHNSGAIVGALALGDGQLTDLGTPEIADFCQATLLIRKWREEHKVQNTLILLDQPTIVANATGRRPVERIVSSAVSRRRGGMQPANTSRSDMFGDDAPVWPFLEEFGGPGDPLAPLAEKQVFETYPVLALIAMGWTLPDQRLLGRLPKYNPARPTYSDFDWCHVCKQTSTALRELGLTGMAHWVDSVTKGRPHKSDQDRLDACLCLLVALRLMTGGEGLVVGDCQTGYIVVPFEQGLQEELERRCIVLGETPSESVRRFKLTAPPPTAAG